MATDFVGPVSAEDDPRHHSSCYPCYGKHLEGKTMQNQYAKWTNCSKCGLRLTYHKKGHGHGHTRQVGPVPSAVMLAVQELEREIPADQCTEKVFNGKLMELQGKRLQVGKAKSMAITQKLEDYLDRTGQKDQHMSSMPMQALPQVPKASAYVATVALPDPAVVEQQQRALLEAQRLASENEALKNQVRMAKESAVEAMRRTEILAKESAEQKAKLNEQDKVVADLTQAAMTAVPKPPTMAPAPKASSPGSSPVTVLTVPTESEDEQDKKKRSRTEVSKASGAD